MHDWYCAGRRLANNNLQHAARYFDQRDACLKHWDRTVKGSFSGDFPKFSERQADKVYRRLFCSAPAVKQIPFGHKKPLCWRREDHS
jgi:hypothetical protein